MHEDIRLYNAVKLTHLPVLLIWGLAQVISLTMYLTYSRQVAIFRQETMETVHSTSRAWDEYRVMDNFSLEKLGGKARGIQQSRNTTSTFDVTLVTQCSVNNLHHVIETLHRWPGPISIAVFAPGFHITHAMFASESIRYCYPKRDIIFQITYPETISPVFTDRAVRLWYDLYSTNKGKDRCKRLLDTLRELKAVNYALGDVSYPHNTLRNVAKRAVSTVYMFLLDIDVMPSTNIRDNFLEYTREIARKPNSASSQMVYVTPAFEMETETAMPTRKDHLIRAYNKALVRQFHAETCPWCHRATKYDDWLSIPETNETVIAFEADWAQSWEPFYISTVDVPDHDERFKQYGYDRISQVCELYVSGFSFTILANAFVIHRGMKRPGRFHSQKNEENRRNFMIFNNEFKEDLKRKYPTSNRSCTAEAGRREGKSKVNFHPRIQRNTKVTAENKPDRDL